jgi:FkbM family methyltransferase
MFWTLNLFREFSPRMTIPSVLRYREILLRDTRGQLRNQDRTHRLSLKTPVSATLTIREANTDLITLQEIFFDQVYGDLIPHLSECRTIIDLGAHIGLATVYFASLFPEASIFSVEPEASNFALLAQNVQSLSRRGRCRPLRAAIWSHDCPLRVQSVAENFYNAFQVRPSENTPDAIQGLGMLSILERSGFHSVDLLKIDVEGAEVQLFQGDLSWLPRVRALAIEFHGDSRQASGFDRLMHGRRVIQVNPHTVMALIPSDS